MRMKATQARYTRRAQSSMELLVTVAFAVTMVLSLIAMAYIQTSSASEQLASDQARQAASKLKGTADAVGAQGPPSKTTIQLTVPAKVTNITVGSVSPPYLGKEIIVSLTTSTGTSEIVVTTLYNVTGDLSNMTRQGSYEVLVEAVDDCLGLGTQCVAVRPA